MYKFEFRVRVVSHNFQSQPFGISN